MHTCTRTAGDIYITSGAGGHGLHIAADRSAPQVYTPEESAFGRCFSGWDPKRKPTNGNEENTKGNGSVG